MKFTMTQVLNKVGCIIVFACFMQCQTMAVTNEQQSLTNQRIVLLCVCSFFAMSVSTAVYQVMPTAKIKRGPA